MRYGKFTLHFILKELEMNLRNIILDLCGFINLAFGFMLLTGWYFVPNINEYMWVPGTVTIVSWVILSVLYNSASKKEANILYDEMVIQRYYQLMSLGYVVLNISVFILFSIQDWQNWSFELAQNLILNLSGLMFLIWGLLLIIFVIKDITGEKNG